MVKIGNPANRMHAIFLKRVSETRERFPFIYVFPLMFALLLAGPSLKLGFIADDFSLLRHALTTPVSNIFSSDFSGGLLFGSSFYRPLVTLSLQLETMVWGTNPIGFHATNVVLYLVGVIGCVLILRELGVSRTGQLVGGIIFAVNPAHVSTVAWVSARSDLVVGIALIVVSFSCFRAATGRRSFWILIAALATIVALLAKESGVLALPLGGMALMLGLSQSDRHGKYWTSGILIVSLLLTAGAYVVLRSSASLPSTFDLPRFASNPKIYLSNLAYVSAMTVGALDGSSSFRQPIWLATVCINVALIAIVLWRGRNRSIGFALGLGWILSGLGFYALSKGSWLAYVPSMGLALLFGSAWTSNRKDWVRTSTTIAYLLICIILFVGWNNRRDQADFLAQKTLKTISTYRPEGILLNVPFNFIDVPVFPNGLTDAVWLNGGPEVHPVIFYSSDSLTGQINVQQLSPSGFQIYMEGDSDLRSLTVGHDREIQSMEEAINRGLDIQVTAVKGDQIKSLYVDSPDTPISILVDGGLIVSGRDNP